jgi:hypothetical protein
MDHGAVGEQHTAEGDESSGDTNSGINFGNEFRDAGNRGDSIVGQLSGQPTQATARSDHAISI